MTTTMIRSQQPIDRTGYTQRELADLAFSIDEHGLEAHREQVSDIVRASHHIAPVAAGVLADRSEPMVARERAFAVVSAALTKPTPR